MTRAARSRYVDRTDRCLQWMDRRFDQNRVRIALFQEEDYLPTGLTTEHVRDLARRGAEVRLRELQERRAKSRRCSAQGIAALRRMNCVTRVHRRAVAACRPPQRKAVGKRMRNREGQRGAVVALVSGETHARDCAQVLEPATFANEPTSSTPLSSRARASPGLPRLPQIRR